MTLDPSWKLDEPSADFKIEVFCYAGVILGAIAYGLHVAVYFSTIHAVWAAREKNNAWLPTIFSTWVFVFSTINLVGNALAEQWTYINYRNYPGGPVGFITNVSDTLGTVGNVAGVMVTWTADALLLWRCYVVWGGRSAAWIVAIPGMMWIAIVVLGSITCYAATQPAGLAALGAVNWNLSFWAIAVTLNMLLTALILARLFYARKNVTSVLGDEYGRTYTGIAAVLIESAAPYAVFGFVWIILYGLQNTGMMLVLPFLVQIEAISPELIILRIAQGKGWKTTTTSDLTTGTLSGPSIRFATGSAHTENSRTVDGASHDALPELEFKDVERTNTGKESV